MNTDWTDALAALRESLPEDKGNGTDCHNAAANADGSDKGPSKLPALTLRYEKKGRGGKPATIISGVGSMPEDEATALASRLKKSLATGGSVRGDEILLLGDQRERLRKTLTDSGFTIKG